jgi:hypothetical protein
MGFCLGILPVNILSMISLIPSIILPYPFLLSRIVQQFSVCLIMSCSYTNVMYFNIIHSLSFLSSFPPPLVSSKSPTFGNIFSVYMCTCVCVCVCVCRWCLYLYRVYHPYMRKSCNLCLSEPVFLHLTWCSPVPSIYLWTTKSHSSLWLNNILCVCVCVCVCV